MNLLLSFLLLFFLIKTVVSSIKIVVWATEQSRLHSLRFWELANIKGLDWRIFLAVFISVILFSLN